VCYECSLRNGAMIPAMFIPNAMVYTRGSIGFGFESHNAEADGRQSPQLSLWVASFRGLESKEIF
jgi:hypothetical protein